MLCSKALLIAAVLFATAQDQMTNVASMDVTDTPLLCITNICDSDADCQIFKDCCQGYDSTPPTVLAPYPPFQCQSTSVSGLITPEYFWMVAECPPDWVDTEVGSSCVQNDIELPPVTDTMTGFLYRNEFCAVCNSVLDVAFWGYEISCDQELLTYVEENPSIPLSTDILAQYCSIERFTSPFESRQILPDIVEPRLCIPSLISECLPLNQIEREISRIEYENLQNRCRNDVVQQPVANNESVLYRNVACASCNNVLDPNCVSEFITEGNRPPPQVGPIPFSATLDIFGDGQIIIHSEVLTVNVTVTCLPSEVYDPVAETCRQTLLCDGVSLRAQCINSTRECEGSLVNLARSEDSFEYLNSSAIIYNDEVYAIEFNTSEGDPVICVNFSRNGTEVANTTVDYYSYPQAFFILTYIGCSLSVIGSTLVLITYTIFKELRTLPSKILMNLSFAIIIANLLILLGGPIVAAFPDVVGLCVASGILLHFFFLSQFSWMSIMSLEMVRVFYRASQMKAVDSSKSKCILLSLYLIVGWGVPLLITVVTIIVNYTTEGLVLYGVLPDGSRGSCWINHLESAAIAFVAPLAVSLIFNCTTFIIVSILLCKASCSQAKLDKGGNVSLLRVHIAVFSTSGLTWIFGFLAILARTSWSWYPFIILNSIQGFIVFLAFLCTKRVAKLYLEKIKPKKATGRPSTLSTKSSALVMKGGLSPKTSFVNGNETKTSL